MNEGKRRTPQLPIRLRTDFSHVQQDESAFADEVQSDNLRVRSALILVTSVDFSGHCCCILSSCVPEFFVRDLTDLIYCQVDKVRFVFF